MTLEAYQNRAKWHAASSTEFRAVLSSLETKLVDRMELIQIAASSVENYTRTVEEKKMDTVSEMFRMVP